VEQKAQLAPPLSPPAVSVLWCAPTASGAHRHLSSNQTRPPTYKGKVGRLLLRGGGRP
jgi:hypothetical protein